MYKIISQNAKHSLLLRNPRRGLQGSLSVAREPSESVSDCREAFRWLGNLQSPSRTAGKPFGGSGTFRVHLGLSNLPGALAIYAWFSLSLTNREAASSKSATALEPVADAGRGAWLADGPLSSLDFSPHVSASRGPGGGCLRASPSNAASRHTHC